MTSEIINNLKNEIMEQKELIGASKRILKQKKEEIKTVNKALTMLLETSFLTEEEYLAKYYDAETNTFIDIPPYTRHKAIVSLFEHRFCLERVAESYNDTKQIKKKIAALEKALKALE
jgi:hemerythrin